MGVSVAAALVSVSGHGTVVVESWSASAADRVAAVDQCLVMGTAAAAAAAVGCAWELVVTVELDSNSVSHLQFKKNNHTYVV